jgi:hypothetical protein
VEIVKNNNDNSFSMEVVRNVATPTFTTNFQVEGKKKRKDITIGPLMQQKYFVGMVCLGMLEVFG